MKKRRRHGVGFNTDLVVVAGCSGLDETVERIRFLFRAHRVEVEFEGSMRFDVLVHPKDAARAVEILCRAQQMTLKDDIRLIPLKFRFVKAGKSLWLSRTLRPSEA